MNATDKNILSARGEALAANLLASVAIQTLFAILPPAQRDTMLKRITAFVDDTLNMSGPAEGDANDEPNTQMREYARFQAMQQLDHIKRMIDNASKG